MPRILVESLEDLCRRHAEVLCAARRTTDSLARLLAEFRGIELLHELKFHQVAFNPFQSDEGYNLVEAVNQSFTALVSLAGARRIIRDHPAALPIRLNIGATGGYDICCEAAGIVAECFAAVTPDNNNKLMEDVERLRVAPHEHKYLFFYSPASGFRVPRETSHISLVHLSLAELYFRRPTDDRGAP